MSGFAIAETWCGSPWCTGCPPRGAARAGLAREPHDPSPAGTGPPAANTPRAGSRPLAVHPGGGGSAPTWHTAAVGAVRRPAPAGARASTPRPASCWASAWWPSAIFLAVSLFLGFGAGPVGGWLEDGTRLLVGRAVALAPARPDRPRRRAHPRPRAAAGPPDAARPDRRARGAADGAGGREPRPGRRDAPGLVRRRTSSRSAAATSARRATGPRAPPSAASAPRSWWCWACWPRWCSSPAPRWATRCAAAAQGATTASRSVGRGVATATVTAIRGSQRLRERLDALEPPTLVGRRRAAREAAVAPAARRRRHLPRPLRRAVGDAALAGPRRGGRWRPPTTRARRRRRASGSPSPTRRAEEQLALADEAPELEPVFAPTADAHPRGPRRRLQAPAPSPRGLLRRSSGPTASRRS